MEYYTNVSVIGNSIYERYIDSLSGKRKKRKVHFSPSLFTKSSSESRFSDIFGNPLQEVNIKDIRDFFAYKKELYAVQDIYGDIDPAIQYVHETYLKQKEIKYKINDLKIFNIDIEIDTSKYTIDHEIKILKNDKIIKMSIARFLVHQDVGCLVFDEELQDYVPYNKSCYVKSDGFPEPDIALKPINAITVYDNNSDTFYTWALEFGVRYNENQPEDLDVLRVYNGFYSESELLKNFLDWWRSNYPDIITGWNCRFFDVPYLINRMLRLFGTDANKQFSPFNKCTVHTGNKFNKNNYYKIYGIEILDYLELYKYYTYSSQESYKLDNIAHVELNDAKLSYSESDGLHGLYRNNFQKFIKYNIKDVDIVKRLDEKKGLINLVLSLAYYAGINFESVSSSIKTWDAIIYNYLKSNNILTSPKKHNSKSEKFMGAYVKESQKGKFNWLVSLDLASLYPSIIRQVNIGPDTLLENKLDLCFDEQDLINGSVDLSSLKKYNLSLAANNTVYRKDKQSFTSILLERLYNDRVEFKKEMLKYKSLLENCSSAEENKIKSEIIYFDTKQHTLKILINSFYGILGTPYFRFYDLRMAEAVTKTGRVVIQYAQKRINEYFNSILKTNNVDYVIMGDTDSLFLHVDVLVKRALKEKTKTQIVDALDGFFNVKIQKFLNTIFTELFEYMNNYESLMVMKREGISDSGIFVSKKRYFARVLDNEGVRYKNPKLKIMGLSLIKSNTPELIRDKIKHILPMFLDKNNDDMIRFINKIRSDWNNLDINEYAISTSVSNVGKFESDGSIFIKGTPIGSKAALIHNKCFPNNIKIQDGDKIKYLFLKMPNPIHQKVIGFIGYLPEELNLSAYIDKDLMFEKSFLAPMKDIMDALNWSTEKHNTLESHFT